MLDTTISLEALIALCLSVATLYYQRLSFITEKTGKRSRTRNRPPTSIFYRHHVLIVSMIAFFFVGLFAPQFPLPLGIALSWYGDENLRKGQKKVNFVVGVWLATIAGLCGAGIAHYAFLEGFDWPWFYIGPLLKFDVWYYLLWP